MRKSNLLFGALVVAVGLLAGAASHARRASADAMISAVEGRTEMVRRLELTDLCVFTEARYTRHPSQADRFTPFQDHPFSLEHFPSGSLVAPPPR
jgi:hypothetical protein